MGVLPGLAGWGGEDENGERAFTRVMGKTPKEMNGEWVRWAR